MISLSLRNRPTTLWSMLQKTSRNVSGKLRFGHFATLAAVCAFTSGVDATRAQDAVGRAVLSDPVSPLPPQSIPARPADNLISTARGSRVAVSTAEAAGIRAARTDSAAASVAATPLQATPAPAPKVSTAEAAGTRIQRTTGSITRWRQATQENTAGVAVERAEPGRAIPDPAEHSALTHPLAKDQSVSEARTADNLTRAKASLVTSPPVTEKPLASEKSVTPHSPARNKQSTTRAVSRSTTVAPVASAPVASAPVASAPVASAPVASAPVASAPVTENVTPPATIPPVMETWHDEYASYIDQVLPGSQCQPVGEPENLGAWWHRESERFIEQNREIVHLRPEHVQSAARAYIAEHTLPPEHDYDVDVYDLKPVAVASSEVDATSNSQVQTADSTQGSDAPGRNRLRTDIRKIRPSLSYAMRNIEENQLPEGFNEKLDNGEYVARQTSPAVLQWAPTNLYHYPLYFEDPALERYGHTYHPVVQPFASAGRFATQLAGIPYQMTLHPVCSREYTLGYYRPGECAPKKHYQIPFNEEAAVMQAAALAGIFLIFP
jgi:hypothetical protein